MEVALEAEAVRAGVVKARRALANEIAYGRKLLNVDSVDTKASVLGTTVTVSVTGVQKDVPPTTPGAASSGTYMALSFAAVDGEESGAVLKLVAELNVSCYRDLALIEADDQSAGSGGTILDVDGKTIFLDAGDFMDFEKMQSRIHNLRIFAKDFDGTFKMVPEIDEEYVRDLAASAELLPDELRLHRMKIVSMNAFGKSGVGGKHHTEAAIEAALRMASALERNEKGELRELVAVFSELRFPNDFSESRRDKLRREWVDAGYGLVYTDQKTVFLGDDEQSLKFTQGPAFGVAMLLPIDLVKNLAGASKLYEPQRFGSDGAAEGGVLWGLRALPRGCDSGQGRMLFPMISRTECVNGMYCPQSESQGAEHHKQVIMAWE